MPGEEHANEAESVEKAEDKLFPKAFQEVLFDSIWTVDQEMEIINLEDALQDGGDGKTKRKAMQGRLAEIVNMLLVRVFPIHAPYPSMAFTLTHL